MANGHSKLPKNIPGPFQHIMNQQIQAGIVNVKDKKSLEISSMSSTCSSASSSSSTSSSTVSAKGIFENIKGSYSISHPNESTAPIDKMKPNLPKKKKSIDEEQDGDDQDRIEYYSNKLSFKRKKFNSTPNSCNKFASNADEDSDQEDDEETQKVKEYDEEVEEGEHELGQKDFNKSVDFDDATGQQTPELGEQQFANETPCVDYGDDDEDEWTTQIENAELERDSKGSRKTTKKIKHDESLQNVHYSSSTYSPSKSLTPMSTSSASSSSMTSSTRSPSRKFKPIKHSIESILNFRLKKESSEQYHETEGEDDSQDGNENYIQNLNYKNDEPESNSKRRKYSPEPADQD